MSNSGNSTKWEAIREIAASSITGNYQPFGGVFTRDIFVSWSTNNTNGDVYLSMDGVTNSKKYAASSARAADSNTNDMFIRAGTQLYIKYDSVPGAPVGWFAWENDYV
jgi:hypothetical protein